MFKKRELPVNSKTRAAPIEIEIGDPSFKLIRHPHDEIFADGFLLMLILVSMSTVSPRSVELSEKEKWFSFNLKWTSEFWCEKIKGRIFKFFSKI